MEALSIERSSAAQLCPSSTGTSNMPTFVCSQHAGAGNAEASAVCSQCSLFDVMHEVPQLLDMLPSKLLAALLAVDSRHRRQVHDHVRHVTLPGQHKAAVDAAVKTFVCGTWTRLARWQIRQNHGRNALRACVAVTVSLPCLSNAESAFFSENATPMLQSAP